MSVLQTIQVSVGGLVGSMSTPNMLPPTPALISHYELSEVRAGVLSVLVPLILLSPALKVERREASFFCDFDGGSLVMYSTRRLRIALTNLCGDRKVKGSSLCRRQRDNV